MQCITPLKNEDASICFQKLQLLTGVRNWVTTLRKPKKEGRGTGDGRKSRHFEIKTSKEEAAQATMSWRLRAEDSFGLRAGNPQFLLHVKATWQHMAKALFCGGGCGASVVLPSITKGKGRHGAASTSSNQMFNLQ